MRNICYRCDRVQDLCVCADIQPVANRTPVTILQHPRERRHPVGTARFLRLGLQQAQLQVCWDLAVAPPAPMGELGLLFPSLRAQNLADDACVPPRHLVVVDGTWTQAKSLLRANPWLQQVPHFRITPDGIDRYRIRKEPRVGYTSTVEATVQALTLIEPQTQGLEALIDAFSRMIDRQVGHIDQIRAGRRRRLRPHVQHPVPAAFSAETAARAVVVYVEVTHRKPHAEIVYLTAVHVATGAVFAQTVLPDASFPPLANLWHLDLPEGVFAQGMGRAALNDAWQAFCGPAAQLIAWNQSTFAYLDHAFGDVGASHTLLKSLYCNWQRGACGSLDDELAARGLVPDAPLCGGRAGRRLADAQTMFRFLRDKMASPAQTVDLLQAAQ